MTHRNGPVIGALCAVTLFSVIGASPASAGQTSKYCHALETAQIPTFPPTPKGALTVTYTAKMIEGMRAYMRDVTGFRAVSPTVKARDLFESVLTSGNEYIKKMTAVFTDLVYLGKHPNDASALAAYNSDFAASTGPFHRFENEANAAGVLSAKLCPS